VSELTVAIERHLLAEVWTSNEVHRNLLHLCDDIGHRFAGSASEHAAAEFLRWKMGEYGMRDVHLEEFPIYSWERGESHVELLSPVKRTIAAIAMPYSPSSDVEGELIDLGEGRERDFGRPGTVITGKVVVIDGDASARPGESRSHRTDKYRRAIAGGAVACLFVNRNAGQLRATGSLYAGTPGGQTPADHEASIPGLAISYEGGALFRRMADRGRVTVHIRTSGRTVPSHSANVIGSVPGRDQDELVVFGAHYDGHDTAQAAGDNAAGALVALEVGRLLAPFAGCLRRTIRIVCFGAEEIGLLGSFHHVERHLHDRGGSALRWAMNLDTAGNGPGGQELLTVTAAPDLIPHFERWGKEHHYPFEVRSGLNPHSDHFPFFLQGFPSGWLASLGDATGTGRWAAAAFGHTEADTVDKVSLRGLQMSAALAARLAITLAQEEELPALHRSPDDVRKALQEAGLSEFLEGHWGLANRVSGSQIRS
jgi:Zn-dependent M28 family amino/carboxypeptidase